MFPALNLPDLDALDSAALKAVILAQHEQHQAQRDHFEALHERYTATLSSRATEIDRLMLLVEKLKHMLFGRKSEKVFCQIEQLEFQIEDPSAALPAVRDLCPRRSRSRSFHAGRMGRCDKRTARSVGGGGSGSRHGGMQAARGRYTRAGARARQRQDEDRQALDIRS